MGTQFKSPSAKLMITVDAHNVDHAKWLVDQGFAQSKSAAFNMALRAFYRAKLNEHGETLATELACRKAETALRPQSHANGVV